MRVTYLVRHTCKAATKLVQRGNSITIKSGDRVLFGIVPDASTVMNINNPARNAIITPPRSNWRRTTLVAPALGVVPGVTGCKESTPSDGGTPAQRYTCPMHPEVVKDGPGDCPKCGIQMVEEQ